VMGTQIFYRIVVWLPLIIPALVVGMVEALDQSPSGLARKSVQVLALTLFYGGIPYAALALWASWWMRGRSEADIKRLMFWAPVLMAGTFAVVAITVGLWAGQPRPFAATAALGAIFAIPIGYGYVALGLLLRQVFPCLKEDLD